MNKKNLAFSKINFILLAISVAIVVLGFYIDEWKRFYRDTI